MVQCSMQAMKGNAIHFLYTALPSAVYTLLFEKALKITQTFTLTITSASFTLSFSESDDSSMVYNGM